MKKILLILVVSLLFISCDTLDYEQVKQVKAGMNTNEMKYLIGEPWDIEVHNGYEEWYYTYYYDGRRNGFKVTVIKSKVDDFYSY